MSDPSVSFVPLSSLSRERPARTGWLGATLVGLLLRVADERDGVQPDRRDAADAPGQDVEGGRGDALGDYRSARRGTRSEHPRVAASTRVQGLKRTCPVGPRTEGGPRESGQRLGHLHNARGRISSAMASLPRPWRSGATAVAARDVMFDRISAHYWQLTEVGALRPQPRRGDLFAASRREWMPPSACCSRIRPMRRRRER